MSKSKRRSIRSPFCTNETEGTLRTNSNVKHDSEAITNAWLESNSSIPLIVRDLWITRLMEQADYQKPASSACRYAGDMREISSIATQTYNAAVGRNEKVALESWSDTHDICMFTFKSLVSLAQCTWTESAESFGIQNHLDIFGHFLVALAEEVRLFGLLMCLLLQFLRDGRLLQMLQEGPGNLASVPASDWSFKFYCWHMRHVQWRQRHHGSMIAYAIPEINSFHALVAL